MPSAESFAVFWGFLFNSFLGMNALPYTVMPDAKDGRYSLMGIKIPSVLVISMLIGMVQLCAGYVCRAVQCWRRGDIRGGIFDGMSWACFMVGLMLAAVGLVEDFSIPSLAIAGGIVAGASLLLAMLTAGRKESFSASSQRASARRTALSTWFRIYSAMQGSTV